jgi:hypothetical protein
MFVGIEAFEGPEYATICCDENGENIVFSSMDEAQEFARNECQGRSNE